MDTFQEELTSRQKFLKYKLPLREVYDREIGTFSHDILSLRENSFGIVSLPGMGEVGLISKARNYSETEYDIMVSALSDDYSTINEIPKESLEGFFSLVGDLYENMVSASGMRIVVGLNQHPNGLELPEEDDRGNKQRVQTLKPLHVHLFEISSSTNNSIPMSSLSHKDQRDICDPLIALSTEIAMKKLRQSPDFNNLKYDLSNEDNPPWGLNIKIPKQMKDFLKNDSSILADLQEFLFKEYEEWAVRISEANEKGTGRINDIEDLSLRSRHMLNMLTKNLKSANEVGSDLLFTKGAAITYTLYQDNNDQTVISVHPRLMSRGNSADAVGFYVNNFEGEIDSQLSSKTIFYKYVLGKTALTHRVSCGEFLHKKEKDII